MRAATVTKDHFETLIDAARQGRPDAMTHLWSRLEPVVALDVARHMGAKVRRFVEVEDMVQLVLSESILRLHALPEDGGKVELLKRLHVTAISRIRDAARKFRDHVGESAVGAWAPDRAVESRSFGSVTRGDSLSSLRRLIDKLPASHAAVVRLCGLDGLSFVEAGERLGVSPDTVRKRYNKIVEGLIKRLR